ncbi:MAG: L-histidine N(alpha)-methyltransferase [Bacteroidota bacterium]
MNSIFAQDVLAGLAASPKRLLSKYFYDERGNRLFQAIMQLDEYYLTRSEYEILAEHKVALLALFQPKVTACEGHQGQDEINNNCFELIEFGAGDGLKIKLLLKYFLEQHAQFKYIPIDISADAVNGLVADLRTVFPDLEIEGVQNDYFRALDYLKSRSKVRKIALFLGANIGNFSDAEAIQFLSGLRKNLHPDDLLMIGFDLKKDPHQILAAYNDASGVTRDFNLNLLQRINNELGGDFELPHFKHYPTYDPVSGEARSYLMSTCEQTVHLSKLNTSFRFTAWEPIHLEISRKYDLPTITRLAEQSGYEVVQHFFDSNHFFVDTVLRPLS